MAGYILHVQHRCYHLCKETRQIYYFKITPIDGRIHLTCTASLPPVTIGSKLLHQMARIINFRICTFLLFQMEMSRSLVVPVYPPLYSGLSAANTLICDIVLVIFSFYFSILQQNVIVLTKKIKRILYCPRVIKFSHF